MYGCQSTLSFVVTIQLIKLEQAVNPTFNFGAFIARNNIIIYLSKYV